MRGRTASKGLLVVDGASMTAADVSNLDAALSNLADANQATCPLCTARLWSSETPIRALLLVCRAATPTREAVCKRLQLQYTRTM